MKKIFTFWLFAISCLIQCYGQSYQVYSIDGDVKLLKGNEESKLVPKKFLSPKDIIVVPENGKIVLFDEKAMKLYTIKQCGKKSIDAHLQAIGNSEKNITTQFLAFLKKKMNGGNEKEYMQSAATSYRDADSLLIDVLIPDPNNTNNKSK